MVVYGITVLFIKTVDFKMVIGNDSKKALQENVYVGIH